MDDPKKWIERLVPPGIERCEAEIPQEYLPPEHPLQSIAQACVQALEERLESLRPDFNLRWSHCAQELGDCWPGIVTFCYFEMEFASPEERLGTVYWLQERIEQLLPDVRNLHVRLLR